MQAREQYDDPQTQMSRSAAEKNLTAAGQYEFYSEFYTQRIKKMYVLNILNTLYTLRFFSLQNAVCFIMLTSLVAVLFTFYI